MKFFKKRPASERLVKFLKEDCAVFRQEVDPGRFLARIEQVGALAAISEFLREAEDKEVSLPPGYWIYLYRLERELKQNK